MEKLRNFILTAFFSLIASIAANAASVKEKVYDEGVITLKSGETIKCEIDNSTYWGMNILYRKDSQSKIDTICYDKIHTVLAKDGEGHIYALENVNFVYEKDWLKGKTKDMQSGIYNVINYGAMNLYSRMVKVYQNGVYTHDTYHYVCRKKDEDYGLYLGKIQDLHKNMFSSKKKKNVVSNFEKLKLYEKLFGDYPELCNMIRDKKLTFLNIEDIVQEYNTHKAETKSDK